MIESFQTERQMTANALNAELLYMEQELAKIKERGDYKEYTALKAGPPCRGRKQRSAHL